MYQIKRQKKGEKEGRKEDEKGRRREKEKAIEINLRCIEIQWKEYRIWTQKTCI